MQRSLAVQQLPQSLNKTKMLQHADGRTLTGKVSENNMNWVTFVLQAEFCP